MNWMPRMVPGLITSGRLAVPARRDEREPEQRPAGIGLQPRQIGGLERGHVVAIDDLGIDGDERRGALVQALDQRERRQHGRRHQHETAVRLESRKTVGERHDFIGCDRMRHFR